MYAVFGRQPHKQLIMFGACLTGGLTFHQPVVTGSKDKGLRDQIGCNRLAEGLLHCAVAALELRCDMMHCKFWTM